METTKNLLIREFELFDEIKDDEAFASVVKNPFVTWAKFILTDDLPNGNKQRIPEDEFVNIIRSGVNMPIKMALKGIKPGHEESLPIGAISHLKQEKNQVVGLAALWKRERPDDIALIKERFANKEPLELSWEIQFTESSTTEDGIEELKGTNLCGVTLVGMPAYQGRTPIVAVASTANTTLEDNKLDELEKLTQKVEELTVSLASKDTEVSELKTQLSELEELREFKASIVKEKEEAEKLDSIKAKFTEAGIEKDEEYFVSNRPLLLGLAAEALEFMIQEVVAFSKKDAKASLEKKSAAPNLTNNSTGEPTIKEMADFLSKSTK